MTLPVKKDAAKRSARINDADDLVIRFVNTVAWRLRDPVEDRMATPGALLEWLEDNTIGERDHLQAVARLWQRQPEMGKAALEAAVALREAVYAILKSGIEGVEPPKEALGCFNRFVSSLTSDQQIAWQAGRLVWRLSPTQADVRHLLMPVTSSAAELMTGTRADKVRQCQDDRGCGWLFVDESRTQTRRWCSMGDCGNRAKARRHYHRVRRHPSA